MRDQRAIIYKPMPQVDDSGQPMIISTLELNTLERVAPKYCGVVSSHPNYPIDRFARYLRAFADSESRYSVTPRQLPLFGHYFSSCTLSSVRCSMILRSYAVFCFEINHIKTAS